jgi:uncharacterized protein (TIGR02246 family)
MSPGSPDACMQEFSECLQRGDVDGAADLFSETATFVHEDGRLVRGRPAVREALAPFVSTQAKATIDIRRVILVADDLAVVYNEWRSEVPEVGRDMVPNAGVGLQLVRRQADGSWRIAFDDPNRSPQEC